MTPVQPGDRAPGFTLPAVNREGAVSLEEFRGRSAVLLGLFRGLHCPFCRRQIVQLGARQPGLRAAGVVEVDRQVAAARGVLLAGQFLIDRDGIVRWAWLEAKDRIGDIAKFPTDEEIWAAVRTLPS